MIKIEASPERVMKLGYAGEDKITQIIFSYTEDWLELGDGAFNIRVLRPGATEAYNATEVVNDSSEMTLTMTVTDIELSRVGYGEMQVVYICNDAIKKSPIYRYKVNRAIDEPVDPPDGSIINQIVRELSELTESKADKSYVDEAVSTIMDHVDEKADKTLATTSDDGLMSSADKAKLDDMYEDYTSAFTVVGGGS